MSEERTVLDVSSGVQVTMSEAIKNDPEETKRLRAEKRAKLARILDRGMVADRLQVDLPADKYGEWIPNDPQDIYRMQLLGFEVDTKYANKRALHSEGDGKSIVGDTVYMTCDRETHELIEEIRADNFKKRNGKPGVTKSQGEEQDFAAANKTLAIGPTVEESVSRNIQKAEIEAALKKANTGVVVPPQAQSIIR